MLASAVWLSAGTAWAKSDANPCVTRVPVSGGEPALVDMPPRGLAIASLNTATQPRVIDSIVDWASRRALDVLLLQEVGGESMDGEAFVRTLSHRLGMWFAYAPATAFPDGQLQGLAIVSRYPLRDIRVQPLTFHRLLLRWRCRIALAATAQTPLGAVRVINLHLDTRINSGSRVEQLMSALEAVGPFAGPRIVGGDFNTANIGWIQTIWPVPFGQRQSKAVRMSLAREGFETPFVDGPPTYRRFPFSFQLDWLYLKGLQDLDWGVDAVPFSDHHGIWSRVQ